MDNYLIVQTEATTEVRLFASFRAPRTSDPQSLSQARASSTRRLRRMSNEPAHWP